MNELNLGEELIIKNKPSILFYRSSICLNILNNLIICNECENLYCCDWVNNHLLNNNNCPTCRKQFEGRKISRHFKLFLNQMELNCPLKFEVNINYENLESHLLKFRNAKK